MRNYEIHLIVSRDLTVAVNKRLAFWKAKADYLTYGCLVVPDKLTSYAHTSK